MLIYFDGCDNIATSARPEWSFPGGSLSNKNGRDASANGAMGWYQGAILTFPSTAALAIVGLAVRHTTTGLFGSTSNYIQFRNAAGAARISITLSATGQIQVRSGGSTGTILATSTLLVTVPQWNHMAFKVSFHTSTGNVVVRVNDIEYVNFTGATSAAIEDVAQLLIQCANGTELEVDDVYVCNGVDGTATDGVPNNDFLGDVCVKVAVPTGPGDSTQWTPSSGANWAAVDELPAVTTDYVGTPNGSALKDAYALTDLASNVTAVLGVKPSVYSYANDAGSASVKFGIRESGVEVLDTQVLSTTGKWWFGAIRKKRPNGSPWTGGAFSDAQLVLDSSS